MINIIAVTPLKGFGFNVKYCDKYISTPGFRCEINELEKLSEHLKFMECSKKQIQDIVNIIANHNT